MSKNLFQSFNQEEQAQPSVPLAVSEHLETRKANMPTYPFSCEKCKNTFDLYLPMSEREQPLSEPCPKCNEMGVKRDYTSFSQPLASDTNMTPDKKTNGQWGRLMSRMKKGLNKKYHATLDNASNRTGRKWN